jgi:hypothetical protein
MWHVSKINLAAQDGYDEDGFEVIVDVWHLILTLANGERWMKNLGMDLTREEAEKEEELLMLAVGHGFEPFMDEGFYATEPVYGSDLYQDDWHMQEYMRMDDEEQAGWHRRFG